jgi:hypothetical protein
VPQAPVVVEIAPATSPAALRQALITACNRAVRDAECVEESDVYGAGTPGVVAIVSWRDPAHAHVDVALRVERQWVARDIDFVPADAEVERWKTVGLVIGTLAGVVAQHAAPGAKSAVVPATGTAPSVGAAPAAGTAPMGPPGSASAPPATGATPSTDASAAPDATTTVVAPPLPPPPPEATPRRVEFEPDEPSPSPSRPRGPGGFLDAGVLVGSALDKGPPRLGAELDARARLVAPFFYGTLGFGYSVGAGSVDGVHSTFAEAFAGLAVLREERPFAFVVHADAVARRFGSSFDHAAPGLPSSADRWLGGARLGAEATYWALPSFGVFVGAAGDAMAGATDLSIDGRSIGSAAVLGYSFRAGVSVGLR